MAPWCAIRLLGLAERFPFLAEARYWEGAVNDGDSEHPDNPQYRASLRLGSAFDWAGNNSVLSAARVQNGTG